MTIYLIKLVFNIVYLLILARVLISWVPQLQYHPIGLWITRATEPFLRPFRNLLPPWRTSGVDFSPMIFFILLIIVERALIRAFHGAL